MLKFAWPWLWFLIPLPWLIYKLLPPATKQMRDALRVPFFTMLQRLSMASHQASLSHWRHVVAYVIWLLLILAAMRPEWMGQMIELPRTGRNILLAVDISGSMQIPDMSINGSPTQRIDAVKQVAGDFVRNREGDRLGLILFGSRPYVQTPLTFDHATISAMLNDATIGLAGPQTAIGDAIGLAIKQLSRLDGERVLILLTDGASNVGMISPLDAARLAAHYRVRIYTIGIGSETVPVADWLGQRMAVVNSDLDEQTLKGIADTTNGMFFRAQDTQGLEEIYQRIDQIEPHASDKSVFRPKQALYYWPLAMAFLLSLLLSVHYLRLEEVRRQ